MSMLYNCLMAQQNIRSFITVDTIIAMPQLQFPNALASCQWKDTLLFVDYHVALHTDSFYVYELGICSHTIDSFCIYIPHLKRKMENENHSSFQYMDRLQNRLILGFSNLLYVLDKCNEKYTLSKRILLPKAVRFAKLWNKKNRN